MLLMCICCILYFSVFTNSELLCPALGCMKFLSMFSSSSKLTNVVIDIVFIEDDQFVAR